MVSIAYHLCIWVQIEIICFVFDNSQNNMISDMPILFQKSEGKMQEKMSLIAFTLKE